MSYDIETELWKLSFGLDQLSYDSYYFSDLPPTAENYEEQWRHYGRIVGNLNEILYGVCVHLKELGIQQSEPDFVNDSDTNEE